MKSITFTTGKFKEEKTSAWLVGFIKKKNQNGYQLSTTNFCL